MSSYKLSIPKYIKEFLNEQNVFTIFTTGILDPEIRKNWFETDYINYILKLIPTKFNVKIFHFDPGYGSNETDIKKKIEEQVDTNERIIESEFSKSEFPFQKIKFKSIPHLLFDFAHIFNYKSEAGSIKVYTSNHYKGKQSFGPDIVVANLKSVYFGYLGDPTPKLIANSKFVEIKANGEVVTFIEKINENVNTAGYSQYPSDYIDKQVRDKRQKLGFPDMSKITDKEQQLLYNAYMNSLWK